MKILHIFTHDSHLNVHSSIIYNNQKAEAPKCPSADERANKLWYIHVLSSNKNKLNTVHYNTNEPQNLYAQ